MNLNSVKTTVSNPIVIGVITLVLGLVLGVVAEKHVGRNSAATRNAPAAAPAKSSTANVPHRLLPDLFDDDAGDSWDPFREMRSLQAEMDEMFRRSIARFRMNPQMGIFQDDAGYSLSLDVRDLKDRYEVRAFLPDAQAPEAKVRLEGNRLEVAVTHRQTEKPPGKHEPDPGMEWGRYTQTVELAGNLKGDQMKVEPKAHELLITIPKA